MPSKWASIPRALQKGTQPSEDTQKDATKRTVSTQHHNEPSPHSFRWLHIKNVGKDAEKLEPLHTADSTAKWYKPL